MNPEETLISVSNLPSVSDYSEEVVIFFIIRFISVTIAWSRWCEGSWTTSGTVTAGASSLSTVSTAARCWGSPASSRPPSSSRGSSITRLATGASMCTGVQKRQAEASHRGSRGQAAEWAEQSSSFSRGRGARASHSRQVLALLHGRGHFPSARGRPATSLWPSPPPKRARELMLW